MKILRAGDKGEDVERWQHFLIGQGFDVGTADGSFGQRTRVATIAFQEANGLGADGAAGLGTLGKAMQLGFEAIPDTGGEPCDPRAASFPPRPSFSPLVTMEARQKIFGAFTFEPAPLPSNAENIRITDGWDCENIVPVTVPEIAGLRGAPPGGAVDFHKLAAPQLLALWAAWRAAGLLDRVLTWSGSYTPRFIRGSSTLLSNHAFGSAFDINVSWNPLGAQPALVGQKGSVRELVQIANAHGFYWGGHFRSRPDGQHFEIAELRREGASPSQAVS